MAAEPVSRSRRPDGRPLRGAAGFTLTELLTVIGLIALVAALLLPVVGRLRATAAAATCLAHLKQMGTAWTLYVTDNRGRLPQYVGFDFDPDTAWKESWPGLLAKQKVSPEMLLCPAAGEASASPEKKGFGSATLAWTGKYSTLSSLRLNHQTYREGSYGYNVRLAGGAGAGAGGTKVFLAAISQPATVPVLFDSAYSDAEPENGRTDSPVPPPPDLTGDHLMPNSPNHWRFVLARHGRGINVCMADGSATWVRLEDLYTLSWKEGWTRYRLPLPAR